MIYSHLLVADGVIDPYPQSIAKFPDQTKSFKTDLWLNVLLACKQIKEEAMLVLCGKNQWVMPHVVLPQHLIFENNREHFRSMLVIPSIQRCLRYARNKAYVEMLQGFVKILHLITRFFKNLRTVVLGLEKFDCLNGCCRWEVLQSDFCNIFLDGTHIPAGAPVIKVKGLTDWRERNFVHEELSVLEHEG